MRDLERHRAGGGRASSFAVWIAPRSTPTIARISSAWVRSAVAREAMTVRPSRSTVTRSVSAKTSSSRCETKTRPRPEARSRPITSKRRSTSPGLSEAVGSSKMRSLARTPSALAISTSCFWAEERRRTSTSKGRPSLWPSASRISSPVRRSAVRSSRPGRPSSGRKMFSRTVRSGTRLVSCITIAMPMSSASRVRRRRMSRPR